MPKNISTTSELSDVLKDINLSVPLGESKINIYCEDTRAIAFLQYVLKNSLDINLELYMNFIDIDLGWTNYVQLAEKKVPEFRNNIIILNGDVPDKKEYKKKAKTIAEFGNFLFLPLVIEQELFKFLKDHAIFIKFQNFSSRAKNLSYALPFAFCVLRIMVSWQSPQNR